MKRHFTSLFTAILLISAPSLKAQAPDAAAEGNPIMHSFGAVSAQALYATYMSIAELGDLFAYAPKQYDKDKVGQLATSYVKLTEAAKDSLSDLVASGKLGTEDEAFINQVILINDLLAKTAQGLVDTAADGTEENRNAFEKNRKKAWQSLSKLLGIGE